MRIFVGFFFVFGVQSADHYERRTRSSHRSSLTDIELKNKLDSIMSLIGKLNGKIEEQEQRIAVLNRKVTNANKECNRWCNGNSTKGTLEYYGLQAVLVPIPRSQVSLNEKQNQGFDKRSNNEWYFSFFLFPFFVLKTKGLKGFAYGLEFFHDWPLLVRALRKNSYNQQLVIRCLMTKLVWSQKKKFEQRKSICVTKRIPVILMTKYNCVDPKVDPLKTINRGLSMRGSLRLRVSGFRKLKFLRRRGCQLSQRPRGKADVD